MNSQFRYNAAVYALPRETLARLTRLRPLRAIGAVWLTWVTIILLVAAARVLSAAFYIPLAFFIAGRQGALLQLTHEGAHGLLTPAKRLNHFISAWLCAAPLGLVYEGYRDAHLRHHLFNGTPREPRSDSEKYRVTDLSDPRLYLLFLKDLVGLTALSIFFAYERNESISTPAKIARLGLAQLAVLGLLFLGDVKLYLLFWCLPAMCAHMFLMRVRGIAEHGLPRQLEIEVGEVAEGTFYTRSFLTPAANYGWAPVNWLEKSLIGSMSVHFHHEHHLFPTVPFYHLAEVHGRIAPEVARRNPDVYVPGYFAAVLRGLKAEAPIAMTEPTL